MNNFCERISLNVELSEISKNICLKYNLGIYISETIVEIGYEDFNYILKTSTGKYFIKVFHKDRTEEEILCYVDKMKRLSNSSVSFPKLLQASNDSLFCLKIKNVTYKLCVFNYIHGQNYFVMQSSPSLDELKEIVRQMVLIQKIDIRPDYIYDSWAIINFAIEFENKKQYLNEKNLILLQDLYNRFLEIDFNKLPYAFVHGDIISTNVIKDEKNKIWIIDFAVSNYYPRIIDLAVTACNLCLTKESKTETYKRISLLLEEYQKYFILTNYEKKHFQLLFELANAMHILQTYYQKGIGNDSKENEYWLNEGEIGLSMSDNKSFEKIIKI